MARRVLRVGTYPWVRALMGWCVGVASHLYAVFDAHRAGAQYSQPTICRWCGSCRDAPADAGSRMAASPAGSHPTLRVHGRAVNRLTGRGDPGGRRRAYAGDPARLAVC
jgi:hypothetical protein